MKNNDELGTFNVAMKRTFIEFIDEMCYAAGFSSRAEYLRALVREDAELRGMALEKKKRKAKKRVAVKP